MSGEKVVCGIMMVLTLCLCTTAGRGEDYKLEKFKVFIMGGGSSLFNSHSFTQDYREWESKYVTGGKAIIGGEYRLGRIVGFEGAYSFGTNNLNITNLSADPNTTTGFGIRVQRVSGNLVVHSRQLISGLQPYATAGLEYARFSPTDDAKDIASTSGGFGSTAQVDLRPDYKFGFNYGAGLEWKLSRVLGFRLDVRDHLTGSPHFKLPTTGSTTGMFPVSGIAHGLEYSAGLVFYFGKK